MRTHAQPSVCTHGQRTTSCLRTPNVLMSLPLRGIPTPFSAMSFQFESTSLGHCLPFSRTSYARSVRSKPLYRHLCSLSALALDKARQWQQESCTFSGTRTSESSPCLWCECRRHRRSRDPRGGRIYGRWSSSQATAQNISDVRMLRPASCGPFAAECKTTSNLPKQQNLRSFLLMVRRSHHPLGPPCALENAGRSSRALRWGCTRSAY